MRSPNAWLQVDFLLGLRQEFGRQIDATRHGGRGHGVVNLLCCQKRGVQVDLYALATLRDSAMAAFQQGQAIVLRDYDTGGTPDIGIIIVHETTEAQPDDGFVSGLIVRALSIHISYTEAYTFA